MQATTSPLLSEREGKNFFLTSPLIGLIDNAGVSQVFGERNLRMAKDFANIVCRISAEKIMGMRPDEQVLLREGRHIFCTTIMIFPGPLYKDGYLAAFFTFAQRFFCAAAILARASAER